MTERAENEFIGGNMGVGSSTSKSPSTSTPRTASSPAATPSRDATSASPGDAAHQPSIDTGQQGQTRETTAQQAEQARQYTVRAGDNLSHIAKDNGLTLNQLLDANPSFRANPNRIHPGQELTIPQSARGATPDGNTRRTPTDVAPGSFGQLSAPGEGGGLERGARGQPVTDVQNRLNELGFNSGRADGDFGPRTQAAVRQFQSANDLRPTGVVDQATTDRLNSPDATRRADVPTDMNGVPQLQRYEPNSPEAVRLFTEAARQAGLPPEWGSSSALHNILRRESGGQVGRPNYTYGSRGRDPSQWAGIHQELRDGRITARSSATGLGQLLLSNVDRYYPNGRAGIGDPMSEATGMLNYIKDRYGSPERAWALYGTRHEGY
jgi:LysM repeat protein